MYGIYPAPAAPESTQSQSQLRLNKITPLSPPGATSNYLDWSFVAELYFGVVRLDYVLSPFAVKDCPPSWTEDNATVCSTLTRIVEDSNLRYLRNFCSDAAGMWASLKDAHQDSLAGGRMYWLRKLVMTKLSGDDVQSHIDEMQKINDQPSALVTADNPLTPDDIFATAVLSLPADWLSCVSTLLQNPSTPSSRIVTTLKAEVLCRKSSNFHSSADLAISTASSTRTTSVAPPVDKPHCTFCKRVNHTTDRCWALKDLMCDHLGLVHDHLRASMPGKKGKAPVSAKKQLSKPERVSRTLIVEDSSSDEEHSNSAVVVSAASASPGLFRWNLDSGTSVSMTPH